MWMYRYGEPRGRSVRRAGPTRRSAPHVPARAHRVRTGARTRPREKLQIALRRGFDDDDDDDDDEALFDLDDTGPHLQEEGEGEEEEEKKKERASWRLDVIVTIRITKSFSPLTLKS